MKNLLIPGLALIAFISSCTSQRYAHVQKVKVKNDEVKEIKHSKIQSELIENSNELSLNESFVKIEAEEIKSTPSNFVSIPKQSNKPIKAAKNIKTAQSKNSPSTVKEIKNLLKENAPEKIKENKAINKTQDSSKNYIKIGLIILLIGFVVGFVFGGLGWLISVVGAVLIVYGLILML